MKSVFDRYYRKYDAWYEKHRAVYLSELEALRKAIPRKGNGLEIGVGTGRFAAPLGIAYGIDPSGKMLALARKRGITARRGNGEALRFKDASFDYVVIIIALCFVNDPVKVLCEARRVLKKNGKIIVAIVDKDSFLGKFYRRKRSVFYARANFFGVVETAALLRTTGFHRITYLQTLYTLPGAIRFMQIPRKGFGAGGFVVIRAYKSGRAESGIYRKFRQYERVRYLFKRFGYDMDGARQKVLERAGSIRGPILDVGTGPGRMAYTLAGEGFCLRSVDISKEAQDVARLYAGRRRVSGRIKFMNMDAHHLQFKDDSFYTVISANLLHDVKDPKRVIEEMIRVAKPKGKIVISDLNKKGKDAVNRVYRINKEIRRGKPLDLERTMSGILKKEAAPFRKYDDGYITTYVVRKAAHKKRGRHIPA